MDYEKFRNTYTPSMMEVVKKFDEIQSIKLSNIIRQGDYTKLQVVKHELELLATAKMLIGEYNNITTSQQPK